MNCMKLSGPALLTLAFAMALSSAPAAAQSPATQSAPDKTSQAPSKSAAHSSAKKSASAQLTLKTQKDKFSYAIGMNMGTNMRKQSVDIDPAILLRGIKDGLAGGKLLLTDEEARAVLTELQTGLRARQEGERKHAAESNAKEGEAFLASNKTKPGVIALPSGLQYKVVTQGSGPKPALTDTVVCNYRGTLINGTEFDSSYKRGEPASFAVNGVIRGWTEALQLMPVGSKWQLFIPSALAYGERGAGGDIGPNTTLLFEVELLSIKPK
jgi:FKBP-type peptidyl-prolyl cis-trans isomerase FklB